MKLLLVAAAIILAVLPAKADEDKSSGNYLIKACQRALDNFNDWQAGYCLGWVDGISAVNDGLNLVCMTDHVTRGQAVRVVVKYLQDHPKDLDRSGAILVAEALQEAWPCPPKKKP